MKPKQCPRCDQRFPDWQPVHLRCFVARAWYFMLAGAVLLMSTIAWFGYPLVAGSISQAQATPIDQSDSDLSAVIEPTASPLPSPSPTPSPTVPRATQTSVPSPLPTQTPVPSPSATSTANIILRQGFDNEANDEESNTNHTIKITNGQLQISVHQERQQTNWLAWHELDEANLSEFTLEVDATYLAGQASNQFGLLAFFENADNYLAFLISNEGQFSIVQQSNGEWIPLHDWTPNSAINTEQSATNRLRISSRNGEIQFEVNDQFLESVQYSDSDEGVMALVAGTQDKGETTVIFDNLVIYE